MSAMTSNESLGRRLPEGGIFMQVSDLFALPPEDTDRMSLWLGGKSRYTGWMPVSRLVARPHPIREAHLSSCPSSMVVVVRYDQAET